MIRVGYAANRRQSAAWINEAPEIVIPNSGRCAGVPLVSRRRRGTARRSGVGFAPAGRPITTTSPSRCFAVPKPASTTRTPSSGPHPWVEHARHLGRICLPSMAVASAASMLRRPGSNDSGYSRAAGLSADNDQHLAHERHIVVIWCDAPALRRTRLAHAHEATVGDALMEAAAAHLGLLDVSLVA